MPGQFGIDQSGNQVTQPFIQGLMLGALQSIVTLLGGSGGVSTTYTPVTTVVTTDGSIPAGKKHIEFILSSDFSGTINGAAVSGATVGIYSPGDAPNAGVLAGMSYTITTGSAILTIF